MHGQELLHVTKLLYIDSMYEDVHWCQNHNFTMWKVALKCWQFGSSQRIWKPVSYQQVINFSWHTAMKLKKEKPICCLMVKQPVLSYDKMQIKAFTSLCTHIHYTFLYSNVLMVVQLHLREATKDNKRIFRSLAETSHSINEWARSVSTTVYNQMGYISSSQLRECQFWDW